MNNKLEKNLRGYTIIMVCVIINLMIGLINNNVYAADFTLTISSSDITDSDVEDTFGTLTITVEDTNLVNSVITHDDTANTITFTVIADTNRTDTVTIKVTDSSGGYDTAEYVIIITAVNDAPYFVSSYETTGYAWTNCIYKVEVADSDIADPGFIITFITLPEKAETTVISGISAIIEWIPELTETYPFGIMVTDS